MEESIIKVEHLSHRYSIQWAIEILILKLREMAFTGC